MRLEDLLQETKLRQAKGYQDSKAYNCWAYDEQHLHARLPRDIADYLASKTEPGCIYYGCVEILNIQFVFYCCQFDYIIDEEEVDDGIEYTCKIDYDHIRQSIESIKIEDINRAAYKNRAYQLLHDVMDTLRIKVENQ